MYKFNCECMTCGTELTITQDEEPGKHCCVGVHCDSCAKKLERYENSKHFGDFICKLRKKYGWSRKYVAKRLGFSSESSIMNFETGDTIMRSVHHARFCAVTPDRLTVPIMMSMFEQDTLSPPCRCVCHQDLNNSIPSIYSDEGECSLCGHNTDGGRFSDSGHWFEVKEEES